MGDGGTLAGGILAAALAVPSAISIPVLWEIDSEIKSSLQRHKMVVVESTQDTQEESLAAIVKRKARKREQDRISQQRKRKNDRETISKLKAHVKALEQQTGDDNHIYNLILEQKRDQDKLKRHLGRVKTIEALVQFSLDDLEMRKPPIGTATISTQACTAGGSDPSKSLHQLCIPELQDGLEFNEAASCIPGLPLVNPSEPQLDAMTWDELTEGVYSKSSDS